MMQEEAGLAALLAEIQAEASNLQLAHFDHADARRLGHAALSIAVQDRLGIVISVMRGPQRAFHAAMTGTTAEHDDWARRKTNTVLRHEVPSLEVVLRHELSGYAPTWLDPLEFAIAGGAVPLFVAGGLAGVIAISGLVGTMREDHDLAMAAVRAAVGAP